MAGASNFMTDTMNAQGLMGLMGPNPYLQYTGQIPMAGYRGAPTDAAGNPIASFTQAQAAHDAWQPPAQPAPQGTTLNSNPGAPNAGVLTGLNYRGADGSLQTYGGAGAQPGTYMQTNPGGIGGGNAHNYDQSAGQRIEAQYQYMPAQQQQQQAPAPSPTNPIDMRQAYLDALSNPGKVTTPGAQMLPGTTPTGPSSQPSVLAQFLSQHPEGGQTGGGGYSNQGFFSTLNALKQGATT